MDSCTEFHHPRGRHRSNERHPNKLDPLSAGPHSSSVGGIPPNGSGDILVAFSTASQVAAHSESDVGQLDPPANGDINHLFEGVVQATEEAIVISLVAGREMVGVNGRKIYGLPHDRFRDILGKYNRFAERAGIVM